MIKIKSINRSSRPRDFHEVVIETDHKIVDCPAIVRWASRKANNEIQQTTQKDKESGEILYLFKEWRDVENFEKWIEKDCPNN